MFSLNIFRREKKPPWVQNFFNKLLFSLAAALLLLAVLPSVSQAAVATLSGNLSSHQVTETNIRESNNLTIILTLDKTWVDDVVSNSAKLNTLLDGFTAASETSQWSKVKAALKEKTTSADKDNYFNYDSNNNLIEITLPAVSGYDISSDQTINISIAPSLLSDSSDPVSNMPDFSLIADCQAAWSNNINSATDIANGGSTISITLTNATWNTGIINLAAKRDNFFDSLIASGEPNEWAKVINALKAAPEPENILELSNGNSTITITLPEVPDYQISAAQTITADYSAWTNPGFISAALSASQPALTFTIAPSFTTAALSGTMITDNPTEIDFTGKTIVITLSNNTWKADITNQAKINALIDGFTAAVDTYSWNLVKTALKAGGVTLTNSNVLTITLPSVSGYNIAADQTVTVNIPSTLLAYNYPVTVTPNTFTIKAARAATVSGTAVPSLTEADIVNGGKTIIITLTSDTWASDVISSATKREALIDGFKFANSTIDTDQWNNMLDVIKASAGFTRVSNTAVTITLPRAAAFNISGSLEVKLTVPGSVINSPSNLPEVKAFTISPVNTQSAKLSGSAVSGVTEADIAAGGKTIVITLTGDVWALDVATDSTKRNNLLDRLTATGTNSDETKWTAALGSFKTSANSNSTVVVRSSDTVVTITLPAYTGFELSGDLIVSLNIPKEVLTTASTSITTSSFTVSAITAVLTGTAITAPPDSSSIIAGGKTIIITLKNATWASDISGLLNGFSSTDPNDWQTIKNKITSTNVVRTSNTVVTIKLPPVPDYTGSSQSVTLTIPQTLITGEHKNVTATPNLQIGSVASATLNGDELSKTDVVDGGETITIELEDCTWATDVVSNTTKLKALLKGFTPDSDTASWNLVIAAIQANLNKVVRTNETVVTIKLPPVPDYDPINEQKVSLTIPKNLLVGAVDNIVAGNKIKIELPSSTKRGTLQSMLDDGSLADYVNEKPLQKIILAVPVKYITSVVVGQTKLDDTVITSLDIYTDSDIDKVRVIVDGETYTSTKSVEAGEGKKYNIGFSYKDNTTTSSSSKSSSASSIDAIISVSGQSDVTIKINGSKTYNLAPSTDLKGSYSLYKLVNDSKLFTNILDYYIPEDIDVRTL